MRHRLQFSIRLLLVATAAAAGGLAAVCAERSFQSAFAINGLTVAFATVAIVAVSRTRGSVQMFWVGTAVVLGMASYLACWSSVWLCMCMEDGTDPSMGFTIQNRFFWVLWCAAPINGLFAVVVDRLFAPRRDEKPPEPLT